MNAAGRGRQRAAEDRHDYRECLQNSQDERRLAPQECPRFPCRVYREGYDHGYAAGQASGYAAGRADGYADGFSDGMAACPGPHGGSPS
jgi:flagellar biosynthesis/type III secretory pathway protein FliH